MLLELLPLALSGLKIGSNDRSELVSSFNCFLFHFTKFCLCLLSYANSSPMLSRIALFPTMWQRMGGLLLSFRLSACKTLPSIIR